MEVPKNPYIGHAHYCTVSYRPVVPSRGPFELVVRRESKELVELFNGSNKNSTIYNQSVSVHNGDNSGTAHNFTVEDMFTRLLDKAQYHHYLYYKIGTCMPRKCSPKDIKSVAKYVGARSILMSGPIKCHTKHKGLDVNDNNELATNTKFMGKTITTTQIVALAALGLFTLVTILLTVYDCATDESKKPEEGLKFSSCQARYKELATASITTAEAIRDKNNKSDIVEQQITIDDEANNNHISDVEHCLNNGHPMDNNHDEQQQHQYKTLSQCVDVKQPPYLQTNNDDNNKRVKLPEKNWSMAGLSKDFSITRNWKNYFDATKNPNDILCLYGLRSCTMIWVVLAHTMQFNDWSEFARAYEIETSIKSIAIQPLFNATYVVDIFYLMSGMVAAYSAWFGCKGNWSNFNKGNYMVSRYLRLTPQVFITSLIYIVFPLISSGPFWDSMSAETSENCQNHWWVNLLHLQIFYKPEEMCNFVSWWISADMLFQVTGLFIFILILVNKHLALCASISIVASYIIYGFYRHFTMNFPPNLMATIPQVNEMWTDMIINFFWKPYCHSYPFILGFWLGYKLASGQLKKISPKQVRLGWCLAVVGLASCSYCTYPWVIDLIGYTRLVSSAYFFTSAIIWTSCFAWIICACHLGYGGWLNNFFSNSIFIVLGKASYIVYLSHMLVLFLFFGNQQILIEPSQTLMIYVIIGNVFVSLLFGSFLYIFYESPCLNLHRRIMKSLKTNNKKQ